MKLKPFLKSMNPVERAKFARRVKTSVEYLRLCTAAGRQPGPELCRKLVAADPRLTLAELRPDLWGDPPPKRKRAKKVPR